MKVSLTDRCKARIDKKNRANKHGPETYRRILQCLKKIYKKKQLNS